MGKYTINWSNNRQYYFNLFAWNGENILTSTETYTTKQGCKDWISSTQINSQIIERYEKRITIDETKFSYILKAKNGEPLWKSEQYNSRSARDNWIYSCMENWKTTNIIDNTI